MAIMLPSLREERAQSYSPFLPIHPKTGVVMQVPIDERNVDAGTIVWRDPDSGERFETPVTGGHAKLQWKPDWAMRWAALGVDYEMSGKDLIDSVKLAAQICRALDAPPPEGFNYELFLDEKGQKISKSKGNGLTIDEWLTYAPTESLGALHVPEAEDREEAVFRRHPEGGRRVLHIPRRLSAAGRGGAARQSGLAHARRQSARRRHAGAVRAAAQSGQRLERPEQDACCGASSRATPRARRRRRIPSSTALVGYAIRYFEDFVEAGEGLSRARRGRAAGAGRACRRAGGAAGRRRRRGDPERRAQRRAQDRALPGPCQAKPGRRARACRSPSSR